MCMTAMKVDNQGHFIGVLIFMETHRRLLHGEFGSIPRQLREWAFAEGGYCLDAPELLPAGGCEWIGAGPPPEGESEEDWGIPSQITVQRP